MSNYGFGNSIRLPEKPEPQKKKQTTMDVQRVAERGHELGFISRELGNRRKPGPKKTEPQSKLTVTGPKRVLDHFLARCDSLGEVAYWQCIEHLLDETEK